MKNISSVLLFSFLILLGFDTHVSFLVTPLSIYLPSEFPILPIPGNNALTEEGVEVGRMLFYDKRLSGDDTKSCATCHIPDKAFTDGLKVSPGMKSVRVRRTFNVPTLTNVAFNKILRWEGRDHSLEEQALAPIVSILEMDQRLKLLEKKLQNIDPYPRKFYLAFGSSRITTENISKALAQFQRTIISTNSKYDRYLNQVGPLTEKELYGLKLFSSIPDPENGIRGGGCINCHKGRNFAGDSEGYSGFKNNGLYASPWGGLYYTTGNKDDTGKFKIPTLRNIEVTGPYMHFGQFNTLEEVLDHYSNGIQNSTTLDSKLRISNSVNRGNLGLGLTEYEQQAIVAFLKTLTDNEFLNNPSLSNPFLTNSDQTEPK